jgi:hypothetical protein
MQDSTRGVHKLGPPAESAGMRAQAILAKNAQSDACPNHRRGAQRTDPLPNRFTSAASRAREPSRERVGGASRRPQSAAQPDARERAGGRVRDPDAAEGNRQPARFPTDSKPLPNGPGGTIDPKDEAVVVHRHRAAPVHDPHTTRTLSARAREDARPRHDRGTHRRQADRLNRYGQPSRSLISSRVRPSASSRRASGSASGASRNPL